ncbi:hypothetical protein NDU88_003233 [Pleurodeles waltl]|uniref:Uncharacterized protein n=1 Tax=Pleurodeles waltl TaxID=8319 RepID=A0AAV7W1J5_PLEWA|nr:hypothetical protein NDU88_003233 [Pleurodeles waltl]
MHGGLRTEGCRCSTLRGSSTLLDIGQRWIPPAPRAYLTMGKLRHKIQRRSQAEQGHVCRLASDEPEEGAAPTTMQDTLNKILGAIEDTKRNLSQEIWKVSSELSHLRTDHHKLADRVEATETSLEELQPAHRALRALFT